MNELLFKTTSNREIHKGFKELWPNESQIEEETDFAEDKRLMLINGQLSNNERSKSIVKYM